MKQFLIIAVLAMLAPYASAQNGVTATPTGQTNQDGEKIFDVVITRGASVQTMTKSRVQMETMLKRALLTLRRNLIEVEEAEMDKVSGIDVDMDAANANVASSMRKVRELRSVLEWMR